jgi:hypothetical protein
MAPSRPAHPVAGRAENWCEQCHAPQCLALARSDTPPQDWKDLADRAMMRLASGHWSVGRTVQVLAVGLVVVLVLALVLWNREVLHGFPQVYVAAVRRWPLVAGGTVAAGGLVVWRRRRRRARASPSTPEAASVNSNDDQHRSNGH